MAVMEACLPPVGEMLAAVRARRAAADGQFFYAVLTTGVFCNPSCRARAPRAENMRFYATAAAAQAAGYRACLRCKPNLPPRAQREAALVQSVCRALEAGCCDEAALAEQAGVSPTQLSRLFRGMTGVTIGAYWAACRQRVVQAALQGGCRVTEAFYEAGFSGSGRFYEAANALLGMKPGAWRRGGAGETIMYGCAPSALGTVLAACTERGICAILLGDDPGALQADLAQRFPKATLVESWPAFGVYLAEIVALVEQPAMAHHLPLDIRGTAFQLQVWQALRAIPPGSTLSYSALAAQLGDKKRARAVAAACAANRLAVAIPCHRAVNSAGGLAGYRWGLGRKERLLAREAGGPGEAGGV